MIDDWQFMIYHQSPIVDPVVCKNFNGHARAGRTDFRFIVGDGCFILITNHKSKIRVELAGFFRRNAFGGTGPRCGAAGIRTPDPLLAKQVLWTS